MSEIINPHTEIRKLPISVQINLSLILDVNEAWKLLMGIIPSNSSTESDKRKYSSEEVKTIEDEAKRQQKPGFEILIDEWGTSGRRRPTIKDLISLLSQVELFRAADYLSQEVLKTGPVPRPESGPAALISSDDSHFSVTTSNGAIVEAINPSLPSHFSSVQEETTFDTLLPHLAYCNLEYITDNFNLMPLSQNGRKLGAGAFGTVFLGRIPDNFTNEDAMAIQIYHKLQLPLKSQLAVKRLNTQKQAEMDVDTDRLFRSEVETMSRYLHENLLKLVAYSADGPESCLVYPFMPNGSLEARLACEGGSLPLQWNHRLDIAQGVALALIHLHTSGATPLVHRDVKSANVLLDENMKPKLGDFGLVRTGSGGLTKSFAQTTNVLGTSAYMAPEAFRGDVSVKLDTFSFGVIILELLTGLPPYDAERDGNDLISHVDAALDEKDFIQLLDPRIPPLPEGMAVALHTVALSCIEEKKKRPLMMQVYKALLKVDVSPVISN